MEPKANGGKPDVLPPPRTSFSWILAPIALLVSLALYSIQPVPENSYAVCASGTNNKVYTVDESLPHVQCFSVTDGHFSAVGSKPSVVSLSSWSLFGIPIPFVGQTSLKTISIPEGSIVVPGLADAHAHIMPGGFNMELPLQSAKSMEDVVSLVRNYVLSNPDVHRNKSHWIQGFGWDQNNWGGRKSFPNAYIFDRDPVLKGRPIFLLRVDGHAAWVSTTVLDMMGDIPKHVEGGEVFRAPNGKLAGTFLDNAMDLIPVPEWSDNQKRLYFKKATQAALAHGLTSIHDAKVSKNDINVFKGLANSKKLPLRVYAMAHNDSSEYWGNQFAKLDNYGPQGRLNLKAVKLIADGALGSWGAALLRPYRDHIHNVGLLKMEKGALESLIRTFATRGWQVATHCIGDRANHNVLDAYEQVIKHDNVDVKKWRPRIEHAQIMTERDIKRMGELGIIASVQPTHATTDMWYAEKRLGPERLAAAGYPQRRLLEASPNKILPLGSDFPVEGINPLLGFYAAITRLSPEGKSPSGEEGWYPTEKLTREQALKGMTYDPAYASFSEHELGSITVGKKADFVVLDKDIMKVPVGEILQTKVLATVIDGEVEYGSL